MLLKEEAFIEMPNRYEPRTTKEMAKDLGTTEAKLKALYMKGKFEQGKHFSRWQRMFYGILMTLYAAFVFIIFNFSTRRKII